MDCSVRKHSKQFIIWIKQPIETPKSQEQLPKMKYVNVPMGKKTPADIEK